MKRNIYLLVVSLAIISLFTLLSCEKETSLEFRGASSTNAISAEIVHTNQIFYLSGVPAVNKTNNGFSLTGTCNDSIGKTIEISINNISTVPGSYSVSVGDILVKFNNSDYFSSNPDGMIHVTSINDSKCEGNFNFSVSGDNYYTRNQTIDVIGGSFLVEL